MRRVLLVTALLLAGCTRAVDLQGAAISREESLLRVLIGPNAQRPKLAYLRLLPCGGSDKQAYYVGLGDVQFGASTDLSLLPEDLSRLAPPGRLCAQVFDQSTPLIRYTSNVVRVVEH